MATYTNATGEGMQWTSCAILSSRLKGNGQRLCCDWCPTSRAVCVNVQNRESAAHMKCISP